MSFFDTVTSIRHLFPACTSMPSHSAIGTCKQATKDMTRRYQALYQRVQFACVVVCFMTFKLTPVAGLFLPSNRRYLSYSEAEFERRIPCAIFTKKCRVCTTFQDALAVKISLDLLKGLWSNGGFKLTGPRCPQIFSTH